MNALTYRLINLCLVYILDFLDIYLPYQVSIKYGAYGWRIQITYLWAEVYKPFSGAGLVDGNKRLHSTFVASHSASAHTAKLSVTRSKAIRGMLKMTYHNYKSWFLLGKFWSGLFCIYKHQTTQPSHSLVLNTQDRLQSFHGRMGSEWNARNQWRQCMCLNPKQNKRNPTKHRYCCHPRGLRVNLIRLFLSYERREFYFIIGSSSNISYYLPQTMLNSEFCLSSSIFFF